MPTINASASRWRETAFSYDSAFFNVLAELVVDAEPITEAKLVKIAGSGPSEISLHVEARGTASESNLRAIILPEGLTGDDEPSGHYRVQAKVDSGTFGVVSFQSEGAGLEISSVTIAPAMVVTAQRVDASAWTESVSDSDIKATDSDYLTEWDIDSESTLTTYAPSASSSYTPWDGDTAQDGYFVGRLDIQGGAGPYEVFVKDLVDGTDSNFIRVAQNSETEDAKDSDNHDIIDLYIADDASATGATHHQAKVKILDKAGNVKQFTVNYAFARDPAFTIANASGLTEIELSGGEIGHPWVDTSMDLRSLSLDSALDDGAGVFAYTAPPTDAEVGSLSDNGSGKTNVNMTVAEHGIVVGDVFSVIDTDSTVLIANATATAVSGAVVTTDHDHVSDASYGVGSYPSVEVTGSKYITTASVPSGLKVFKYENDGSGDLKITTSVNPHYVLVGDVISFEDSTNGNTFTNATVTAVTVSTITTDAEYTGATITLDSPYVDLTVSRPSLTFSVDGSDAAYPRDQIFSILSSRVTYVENGYTFYPLAGSDIEFYLYKNPTITSTVFSSSSAYVRSFTDSSDSEDYLSTSMQNVGFSSLTAAVALNVMFEGGFGSYQLALDAFDRNAAGAFGDELAIAIDTGGNGAVDVSTATEGPKTLSALIYADETNMGALLALSGGSATEVQTLSSFFTVSVDINSDDGTAGISGSETSNRLRVFADLEDRSYSPLNPLYLNVADLGSSGVTVIDMGALIDGGAHGDRHEETDWAVAISGDDASFVERDGSTEDLVTASAVTDDVDSIAWKDVDLVFSDAAGSSSNSLSAITLNPSVFRVPTVSGGTSVVLDAGDGVDIGGSVVEFNLGEFTYAGGYLAASGSSYQRPSLAFAAGGDIASGFSAEFSFVDVGTDDSVNGSSNTDKSVTGEIKLRLTNPSSLYGGSTGTLSITLPGVEANSQQLWYDNNGDGADSTTAIHTVTINFSSASLTLNRTVGAGVTHSADAGSERLLNRATHDSSGDIIETDGTYFSEFLFDYGDADTIYDTIVDGTLVITGVAQSNGFKVAVIRTEASGGGFGYDSFVDSAGGALGEAVAESNLSTAISGESTAITGLTVSSAGALEFNATAHGLSVGQVVNHSSFPVDAYNGAMTVTRVDTDSYEASSDLGVAVASVADNGSSDILITTENEHGLSAGDLVAISKSSLYATTDGAIAVETVPSSTTFTVDVAFAGASRGFVRKVMKETSVGVNVSDDGGDALFTFAEDHSFSVGDEMVIDVSGYSAALQTVSAVTSNTIKFTSLSYDSEAGSSGFVKYRDGGSIDVTRAHPNFEFLHRNSKLVSVSASGDDALFTSEGHGFETGDSVSVEVTGYTTAAATLTKVDDDTFTVDAGSGTLAFDAESATSGLVTELDVNGNASYTSLGHILESSEADFSETSSNVMIPFRLRIRSMDDASAAQGASFMLAVTSDNAGVTSANSSFMRRIGINRVEDVDSFSLVRQSTSGRDRLVLALESVSVGDDTEEDLVSYDYVLEATINGSDPDEIASGVDKTLAQIQGLFANPLIERSLSIADLSDPSNLEYDGSSSSNAADYITWSLSLRNNHGQADFVKVSYISTSDVTTTFRNHNSSDTTFDWVRPIHLYARNMLLENMTTYAIYTMEKYTIGGSTVYGFTGDAIAPTSGVYTLPIAAVDDIPEATIEEASA